jgi:hypothetical protein
VTAPLDEWRVCARPVTTGKGRGCTCLSHDPTARRVIEALTRLNHRDDEEGGAAVTAPQAARRVTGTAAP